MLLSSSDCASAGSVDLGGGDLTAADRGGEQQRERAAPFFDLLAGEDWQVGALTRSSP
jgi:hypothetical protein